MMAARPWLCCPPRILRLLLHCPALVWCGPLWTLTLTLIDSARGCCNSEATARKLVGTSPRVYPCFRARLSARRCLALRRGRRGSVAPCLHCCLTPRGPPSPEHLEIRAAVLPNMTTRPRRRGRPCAASSRSSRGSRRIQKSIIWATCGSSYCVVQVHAAEKS